MLKSIVIFFLIVIVGLFVTDIGKIINFQEANIVVIALSCSIIIYELNKKNKNL